MDYIRRTYGIPAKRGALVLFTAAPKAVRGRIVGSRGGYLRIRWEDSGRTHTHHPTWSLVYLEPLNASLSGQQCCIKTDAEK